MDLTVYTSIFGWYDVLNDPKKPIKDIKYICFTDKDYESDVWEIIKKKNTNIKDWNEYRKKKK